MRRAPVRRRGGGGSSGPPGPPPCEPANRIRDDGGPVRAARWCEPKPSFTTARLGRGAPNGRSPSTTPARAAAGFVESRPLLYPGVWGRRATALRPGPTPPRSRSVLTRGVISRGLARGDRYGDSCPAHEPRKAPPLRRRGPPGEPARTTRAGLDGVPPSPPDPAVASSAAIAPRRGGAKLNAPTRPRPRGGQGGEGGEGGGYSRPLPGHVTRLCPSAP